MTQAAATWKLDDGAELALGPRLAEPDWATEVRYVFEDPVRPARGDAVLARIPADTVCTVLTYVEGEASFAELARVFTVGDPRLAGVYFPSPAGGTVERWTAAAMQAIEACVVLKVRRRGA
jgi:hypothetical protein